MPSPHLGLNQTLALSQKLKLILSPQMLQLLKTLHLPYTELIDSINKEVTENPALELAKQDELIQYARSLAGSREYIQADYDDSKPDKELKARGPSLQDHLLQQIRLESLDEGDEQIAEELIGNIDTRGYLENYPEVRDQIMERLNVAKCNVDKVLGVIQTLEPEGVGARNLKECLLIQVREYNFDSEDLRQVINDAIKYHLEDIEKKKFAEIAEDLEIELEGVTYIVNFIEKNLNPSPGNLFKSDEQVQTVIPSFIIKPDPEIPHKYIYENLESSKGPQLRLNSQYITMFDNPNTDEETKNYLKEKIAAAKQFMDNINRRHQTINKIIEIINSTQQEFFEYGYYWLKPLQQGSLANSVGVHPSTISRAVSTKYAETPQGLYPLRYLCPRNFKGYSPMQIKGILRKVLRDEKKLSDQKISGLLKDTRSIEIKRRTVTKYRMELGEQSSYERKKEENPPA
jgi:RNA polymerase sigma-54 factor